MSKVDSESTDRLIDKKDEIKTDREAAWDIWALAKNITLGAFFHPIYTVVNAAVLGRVSANELAGCGLGSLTTGIMCLSIGANFGGGFSTFCGQSFGSKDHRLCRVYLNRQLFLIVILYALIAIPILFIEQIWTAIDQDPEVMKYSILYVRIVFPALFFYFLSQTFVAFASQQRLPQYSRNSTILGTCSHATFVAILVGYYDMGFLGVCYSTAAMFLVRFTSNFLQVWYSKDIPPQNDVYFFSRETVSNIWPLLSLNLKSMAMGIWGWWAFDIFTLIASYMSKDEVATQTIMRSVGLMTFMIPVGFAMASGTCVSNAVGGGKIRLAQQYCRMSMQLTTVVCLVQILLMIIFRDSVIGIFTNLDEIKALMILTWPTLMVFCFFDTTQQIGSSIVRATGNQGYGAWLTMSGYWVLGIPISCLLVFKYDMSLNGLWVGPTVACAYITACMGYLMLRVDWDELVALIEERKQKEKQLQEDLRLQQKEQKEATEGESFTNANTLN